MHVRRCLPPLSLHLRIYPLALTFMPQHPIPLYLSCCLPIHLELPVGLLRERYVGEVANEMVGVGASQEELTT